MANENNNQTKSDYNSDLEFDLGSDELFAVCNNGNYFYVAFDELFHQSAFEVYNRFELNSKRNFKNLAATIWETYQELFLNEKGILKESAEIFFFNILKTKSDIMAAEAPYTYEKFLSDVDRILSCGNNFILKEIDNFVETNYALNLDAITEDTRKKKHKINTELQFSDEHAKELLKISYLYRVMIPIISVYFYYNKNNFNSTKAASENDMEVSADDLEEMKFDEVNSTLFTYLFNKFAKNPEALKNKLYKLAYSGVSKTSYSDKKFWLAAKNVAITEEIEALEIYKKLIMNAIPKLSIDGDKNVVSFLQSVINNQVDFLFQNKFKNHFIPFGSGDVSYTLNDDDDSAISEFERIEIQQSRKNEGEYIIRKLNIEKSIKDLPEKLNVGVSDAEVKSIMQVIKRNSIQEQIIASLTFKYFNDTNALKFVSFYQYCYLLIACKKYLIQQKYIYLPQILTAICEKHRERLNISGKKVKPEILNSKKYKELIETKYPNLSEEIERPFLAFIGTVYSSVFKDAEGNEIFDSTVKVGKIAEEIVDLAYLI